MPWQLIYTSAPRGLAPGHSGLCTVARSSDMRDAITQRLEQISSYHYLDPASVDDATRNPALHSHRILDLRGSKYHVLSRIRPCGFDFSARTNHLAHHLLFQPDELPALPSPAVLLRHWPGWLNSWEGEPRLLESLSPDSFKNLPPPSWPARTWQALTGDAGRAAGLLESEYARGCYLLCPPGKAGELLDLFCETLQLLDPDGQTPFRPWQHTFTTFLQAEDPPADFLWRGCQPNSPALDQALRRSATPVEIQSIRVPDNPLARLARDGPPSVQSPAGGAASIPPALRRLAEGRRPGGLSEADFARNVVSSGGPRSASEVVFGKFSLKTVIAIGIALLLLLGLLLMKRYIS